MNKQGLITIIFIALTALAGWRYFRPALNEVFVLRQELKVEQTKLSEARVLKEKLSELEIKYNGLSSEADRIAQAVTKKKDLPGLLVLFEALSSQNGLILDSVAFSFLDDNKENKEAPSLKSGAGANVKVLTVDLNLNGSQNSLESFLKAVEENLRIMDVSAITFEEQSEGDVSLGRDFKVSLNTYFRE